MYVHGEVRYAAGGPQSVCLSFDAECEHPKSLSDCMRDLYTQKFQKRP